MRLPHELQTFLSIIAADMRIAADRLPADTSRDPYTGVVSLSPSAIRTRLRSHAGQCEKYVDQISKLDASDIKPAHLPEVY